MFGTEIVGSSHDVPQWILDLVDEVEAWYGFCTNGIYFKESKSNYRGGCYRPREGYLHFYFGREETPLRKWIVLHELAHAWQYLECPETLTPKAKGKKNRVVHNDVFWEIAKMLYIKYDVLEVAAENEYKRARKLMVK